MKLFIVNPIAGTFSKKILVSILERNGYRIVYTSYPGEAEILARETDADTVIAVGGDGTVNEVARGLMGTGKTLGIIPCGSGDGLALHLGLNHNLYRTLRIIERGKTKPLDAALINGRLFFSVCGVGLDAKVSEKYAKSGKRGLASYLEQAFIVWKDYEPERYTLEIDGHIWSKEAVLITVGNSDQWGNRAKVTPLADSGDGELDITIVDRFGSIEIPKLAFRLMTGTVDSDYRVHCYRGKHIAIHRESEGPAHVDGEWFDAGKEIDIKVIPHALNVIIP